MDKLLESIQDLWFDFYARLLPGIFTLAVLKYYDLLPFEVTLDQELVLLVMAYLLGHFLQPWSSYWTRWFVDREVDIDDYNSKKSSSDPLTRNMRLAEKAYAEAVGFWAMTFASIIVFLVLILMDFCEPNYAASQCCVSEKNPVALIIIGILMGTLACERTFTRIRKIRRVTDSKELQQSSSIAD